MFSLNSSACVSAHHIVSDGCGSNLIAIEQPQTISTPGYPHQYRSNLACTWAIAAGTNYLIRLENGYVSNRTCCETLEVNFCVIVMIKFFLIGKHSNAMCKAYRPTALLYFWKYRQILYFL